MKDEKYLRLFRLNSMFLLCTEIIVSVLNNNFLSGVMTRIIIWTCIYVQGIWPRLYDLLLIVADKLITYLDGIHWLTYRAFLVRFRSSDAAQINLVSPSFHSSSQSYCNKLNSSELTSRRFGVKVSDILRNETWKTSSYCCW